MFEYSTAYRQKPVEPPVVHIVAIFSANTAKHLITREDSLSEWTARTANIKEPTVIFQSFGSRYQVLPLSEFRKLYDIRLVIE